MLNLLSACTESCEHKPDEHITTDVSVSAPVYCRYCLVFVLRCHIPSAWSTNHLAIAYRYQHCHPQYHRSVAIISSKILPSDAFILLQLQ
jgi:hypothetical protein